MDANDDLNIVQQATAESFKPLTSLDRRLYMRSLLLPDLAERAKPLHRLKEELQKIQDEYCRELFELERKYHVESQEFYDKREQIINGLHDPHRMIERNWKHQTSEIDLDKFTEFYKTAQSLPANFKGVPNFWLHILTTSDTISQLIYPPDVQVLSFLTDIKIDYGSDSFTLEFHFKENKFFENSVLTKTYWLRKKVDENNNPYGFEGYRMYKCSGCWIKWRCFQNLAWKVVYRKDGRQRMVPMDSFFNFFNSPLINIDNLDEVDDATLEILNEHFKIGNFFREEIIPNAMMYFTGDIIDDLDEGEEEAYDSDEDCVDLMAKPNDKHFAQIGRALRRIHWN